MKYRYLLFTVLCLCVFCLFAAAATTPVSGPSSSMSDYVKAKNAAHAAHTRLDAVVTSVCNSVVCVQLGDDGEFNIGTADGRSLTYFYPGSPWSTNLIVSVDGMRYPLEAVSRPACDGNAVFTGWTNDTVSIHAYFTINDVIHVDLILTPVMFTATTGAILTQTIVTNGDPTGATHQIGILYEYDTTVDGDDAAQLYLGPNYVNVETCYDAPFPSTYWDAIPASSALVGRGTFTGGLAVTPDHLSFGSWPHFNTVCWDVECSGNPYGDSSVLYKWDESPVPSGGSRTVGTYYGVGTLEVQPGNLQIAVSLPPLECQPPMGVQPNPFQLLVNISNTGGSPCNHIVVDMSNGSGPGGVATITSTHPQEIEVLNAGANQSVSFTAQLSPTTGGGCIYFTASAEGTDCSLNENNFCVEVPPCDPINCVFHSDTLDLGDLFRCNYPTTDGNPAHELTHIAWLGEQITGEIHPHIFNADPGDDGVHFRDRQWFPCRQYWIDVTVTAGPNYPRYVACGGNLYLNAWKDGNLDNDFCDELCNGQVSEWIIQDLMITPGVHPIQVTDPGVYDMDTYAGIFRFRLTSQPVGRFGFARGDHALCPNCTCPGTFARDFLGEVEDYYLPDFQLAVTLSNFDVTAHDGVIDITWATASEQDNGHFTIMRNDNPIANISSQGNSASGHNYRYTDQSVVSGNTYTYSLISEDLNGTRTVLGTRTVTASGTVPTVITEYALRQNYPNPFNPKTQIEFDLVESGFVTISVYNPVGQLVTKVVDGKLSAGPHTVSFDATGLPSGLYLYRMDVNGYSVSRKMLLMK